MELDYNKILEELQESRKSLLTCVPPKGYRELNYDFTSLYPISVNMNISKKNKNIIRKINIKNIFPDIE